LRPSDLSVILPPSNYNKSFITNVKRLTYRAHEPVGGQVKMTVRMLVSVLAGLLVVGADLAAQQNPVFETTLVGVVIPDDIQKGDQAVGTVTLEPQRYMDAPGLRVITAEVPTAPPGPSPTSNSLSGTIIEVATPSGDPGGRSNELTGVIVDVAKKDAKGNPRTSIGKIFLTAAQLGADALPLVIRRPGSSQPIHSESIPVQPAAPEVTPDDYEMPPVISQNDVERIAGRIGTNPAVLVDDTPTEVIASTPRETYFSVPQTIALGPHTVTCFEQPVPTPMTGVPSPSTAVPDASAATPPPVTRPPVATTPETGATARPGEPARERPARTITFDGVTLVGLSLRADGPTRVVPRGNETPIVASVVGRIPDEVMDRRLPRTRDLLHVPLAAKKGAPSPGDRGKIAIVIRNYSPGVVSLDKEQNGAVTKWFDRGDVRGGNLDLKTKILARRAGNYHVFAQVVTLLPPIQGRVETGGR
jgi:hypothetical protein